MIGIDVGTSGARAVAVSVDGKVVACAVRSLNAAHPLPDGTHEQDPADWWQTVCTVVREVVAEGGEVAGVAVTSTSGSLVVADEEGRPLRAAMLYDDRRGEPGATGLSASYSLAKALWVAQHEGEVWDKVRHILHPADWLASKLTGEFGVSDFSNCLKLGYDPAAMDWGPVVAMSGVPRELLPRVLRPGERAGVVKPGDSALPAGVPVFAGATDGIACLIASGANSRGALNTTLGTTLVWKALSATRPEERNGIYSHLHPSGLWAPGAASNSGPGSIKNEDPPLTPEQVEQLAQPYFPATVVCYPLAGRGERFPFQNRDALSFFEGRPSCRGEWCAAQLQSIGFVERWGYEALAEAGVALGDTIYTSGGGAAQSGIVSQMRADILGRTVVRAAQPGAAFGAAVLAATGAWYGGDVMAAIGAMTQIVARFTPNAELAPRYEEVYIRFREACRQRGCGQ
ncbi:MAG: FGGY-family carbohydrate kinase [Bryobacteraceae bacterium]